MEGGASIFIEVDVQDAGFGPSRSGEIAKRKINFSKALESAAQQAEELRRKLSKLQADEVEVKFGLKTDTELGNFAIGKVGLEANYEVTLKWSNKAKTKSDNVQ